MVALAERRRAPRAWRRPGRCSLHCAPLRAALPFGAAVVVQTPAPIAQIDPTPTNPSHEPDHQTMYLPGAVIQNRTRNSRLGEVGENWR